MLAHNMVNALVVSSDDYELRRLVLDEYASHIKAILTAEPCFQVLFNDESILLHRDDELIAFDSIEELAAECEHNTRLCQFAGVPRYLWPTQAIS